MTRAQRMLGLQRSTRSSSAREQERSEPEPFARRIAALSLEHQRGIRRFAKRVGEFLDRNLLSQKQYEVVLEHVVRLGERNRNPANTGNVEDLFCHTLLETLDPLRAFAQALADSVKVVPMDEDAVLRPVLRSVDGSRRFERVRDLAGFSPGDKMLVTHTMVAYGDEEMRRSALDLVRATHLDRAEDVVRREEARMAVQSQHHPSSSFVLARFHGLTIECEPLYREAGYGDHDIANAQKFYDVCGAFQPLWAHEFTRGRIPRGGEWRMWRRLYLAARAKLPEELIYQLSSDTLTNFLEGTLESGKWTDACVFFGGVRAAGDVPAALACIVNQYVAEHIALHDRPAEELTVACEETLEPWGIGFVNDRAVVINPEPVRFVDMQKQFEAAILRRQRGHETKQA